MGDLGVKLKEELRLRAKGEIKVPSGGFMYICAMKCRENCGACCIALSISSPIPGMPDGKPAGVRCIHLMDDYRCAIYNSTEKPKACTGFTPEPDFCGSSRGEAMRILGSLSE